MPLHNAFAGGIVGKTTASLDTPYYQLIPPHSSGEAFTSVLLVNLTNGNTATNLVFMRPIGKTTTSAASNVSVNTVTLTADPGNNAGGLYNTAGTNNNIAANDVLVIKNTDGTFTRYTVGAWNGTSKVATLVGSTLASNVSSGGTVWFFGINTDTDPLTGSAHPIIPNSVAANTTGNAFSALGAGFRGAKVGDPLLVYCSNCTNAVTINYTEFASSIR